MLVGASLRYSQTSLERVQENNNTIIIFFLALENIVSFLILIKIDF